MMRAVRVLGLVLAVILLNSVPIKSALAACTSPVGEESKTIYDTSAHVVQYCNGTSWLTFAAGTAAAAQWSAGASGAIYYNIGPVGIGTTSPTAQLDIRMDAGTGTVTNQYGIYINRSTGAAATATNAYGLYVNSLDYQSGLATTNAYGLYLGNFYATGNKWGIYQNDTTSKNYFAGNVGIGTTSPAQPLDVNGVVISRNNGENFRAYSASAAANDYSGYGFSAYDGTRYGIIDMTNASKELGIKSHNASGYITFYTGGYNERMRITSSGNVGIGTANPLHKLHVIGNIVASESPNAVIQVDGTSTGNPYYEFAQAGIAKAQIQYVNSGSLLQLRNNGSNAISINASGSVGIGTTNPTVALQVSGNIISSLAANPAGNTMCYASGTNVFGYCSSDVRLKKDIAPINTQMLDAVMKLKPVTFKWINKDDNTYAGFIAQEVAMAIPLAARKNPDGHYGLDSTAIEAYLVGAIQELKADNDKLRTELEAYKAAHP